MPVCPPSPQGHPGGPPGVKIYQNISFLADPSAPKYHNAGSRNGVLWYQMALWSGPGATPSPRSPRLCAWAPRWPALWPTFKRPFGASKLRPGRLWRSQRGWCNAGSQRVLCGVKRHPGVVWGCRPPPVPWGMQLDPSVAGLGADFELSSWCIQTVSRAVFAFPWWGSRDGPGMSQGVGILEVMISRSTPSAPKWCYAGSQYDILRRQTVLWSGRAVPASSQFPGCCT